MPYRCRKNQQGDIPAILDNPDNAVLRYVYDAWGNHTVTCYNSYGTVIPSNTSVIPSNTSVIPSNTSVIPSNTSVIPSNTSVIPSNTSVILSESEESQSHMGNLNPVMLTDNTGTSIWSDIGDWLKGVAGKVLLTIVRAAMFAAGAVVGGLIGFTMGAGFGALGFGAGAFTTTFAMFAKAVLVTFVVASLVASAAHAVYKTPFVQDIFDTWADMSFGEKQVFMQATGIPAPFSTFLSIGLTIITILRELFS